jgi:hypothetical protein
MPLTEMRSPVYRIIVLYILLWITWIILTDPIVDSFITNPSFKIQWIRNKRFIFIIISAGLLFYLFNREISERKRFASQQELLIGELTKTLEEIKVLRGFLPICAYCRKIRNDEGYWQSVESYLHDHADIKYSHGVCPDCAAKVISEIDDK